MFFCRFSSPALRPLNLVTGAQSLWKWLQKVPKMEPKAIQVDMVGPLQNYGRCHTDDTLGHFGWGLMTTFVLTAFRMPLFTCVCQLWRKTIPKWAQKGRVFYGKTNPFFDRSPKVAQLGSKGGQGLQKDTKMEPQVTKMDPKWSQIQVLWSKTGLEMGATNHTRIEA